MLKVLQKLKDVQSEVALLQAENSDLYCSIKAIDQLLHDYRSFDLNRAQRFLSELEQSRESTLQEIESAHEIVKKYDDEKNVKGLVFTDPRDQKYFWTYWERIKSTIAMPREFIRIQHLKSKLKRVDALLSVQSIKIASFHDFDEPARLEERARIAVEVETLSAEIERKNGLLARYEKRVGPLLNQHAQLMESANRLRANIDQANRWHLELETATDGRQKRRVHKRCEEAFGTSSPSKVAQQKAGKLRSLERDLVKLESRIEEEVVKLERVVKRIVIDGNNVCYDDARFIGFTALGKLADKLKSQYDLMIVFDASIRRLMKSDDIFIRSAFDKGVEVKVVPTGESADKYILQVAEGKSETYVLSNDRFADFPDYGAVRDNRMIRFSIIDQRIFVLDLDLDIPLLASDR